MENYDEYLCGRVLHKRSMSDEKARLKACFPGIYMQRLLLGSFYNCGIIKRATTEQLAAIRKQINQAEKRIDYFLKMVKFDDSIPALVAEDLVAWRKCENIICSLSTTGTLPHTEIAAALTLEMEGILRYNGELKNALYPAPPSNRHARVKVKYQEVRNEQKESI